MTQCRGIPTEHARRDTDALAFITRWQRFAERSPDLWGARHEGWGEAMGESLFRADP